MGILAVIVLFNPDVELLKRNTSVLAGLSIPVMLYDNTPGSDHFSNRKWAEDQKAGLHITYLGDGENRGVATAYNTCIRDYLDDDKIDAFLTLDQDTVLDVRSLLSLIRSYKMASSNGKLGVIGGKPVRSDGTPYRYKVTSREKIFGRYADALLVISSFSIVSKSCIREVGLFQEDFFIDHVDYDFCWRCKKKDYLTLIDEEVRFTHSVGIGDVKIFGRYICPISAPFRGYYQVRNTILSARRGGAPLFWAAGEIAKRFTVVLLNGFADRNLFTRLGYAFKGLFHGIGDLSGRIK